MKTTTRPLSDYDKQRLTKPSDVLEPLLPKTVADSPAKPDRTPSPDDAMEAWSKSRSSGDFDVLMRTLEPTIQRGLSAFGSDQKSLRTKARVLAARAVRSYDPKKASKRGKTASITTHVYGNLQRLNRIRSDRNEAIRMPERVRMDAITMRDAVNEWRDAHNDDEPDLQTLSEKTGLSMSRLKLASQAYREISAAGLQTEKGDTLLQTPKGFEEDPWRDYVYHDLDQKGRRVFEMTTGYGGSRIVPKSEIAKRLGMTSAAVSGRIGTILKRLQERPSGDIL